MIDSVSLGSKFILLAVLLFLSAFFSISETAMMAANRLRLRHAARQGHRGAKKALALLARTDKLLGVILLGNNLVNAAAATLVSVMTIELVGDNEWALGVGTLVVTFSILVFSEITPKIIGANHADRLAAFLAYILTPLLHLFYPLVWFVNLFAQALLKILHISTNRSDGDKPLSREELRTLVLESSHTLPAQHRTILDSLFALDQVCVEDIMTPIKGIEVLDIERSLTDIKNQLMRCQHSRLPVCQGSLDQLIGILPVRRLVGVVGNSDFSVEKVLSHMRSPYYIPVGTPIFSQLAFFRENSRRTGLIVDEYGEIQGLVTLADIVEELVGDFTGSMPGLPSALVWSAAGDVVVDGSRTLRELNRRLGLNFPLDGAKTLNGLITDWLEEIPEGDLGMRLCGVAMEVLQAENRRIVTVRLFRPTKAAG